MVKQISKNRIFLVFVAVFIALLFCIHSAYAAELAGDRAAGEFLSQVKSAYGVFKTVATTFGAVGIAFSGIKIISGNEEEAGKAAARILVILGAVAALWLLPSVINLGAGVGKVQAWDPSRL